MDIHPDEAKIISEGYSEDPELSYIIKKLSSTSKEDALHTRYLWDENKQRLSTQPARYVFLVDQCV